jgi:hypothetical protein
MDGVYNRKYFAKKATQARDKLRELGGVAPTASPQVSGIMASSPELMQAAMRRPVVLPPTQAPAPMAPAPQPSMPMLPPSQPIPNIAGIPQGPAPTASAPRPMAQKPGVKKMQGGGILDYTGPISGMSLREKFQSPLKTTAKAMQPLQRGVETPFTLGFKKSVEFAQKAITSKDPTQLGLPEGADIGEAAEMLKDSEAAAADIIADTVPPKQQTGDTRKDLLKAAKNVGVEQVPAEAEIDELNKAIFGAKLAGAIAGSYVNPQTGQELRPTAGARIANAAVEGLAVARDTETRRAEQEAALAKARIAARSRTKTGKGFLDSTTGKSMLKMAENAIGKDFLDAAALEEFMLKAYGQEAYDAYRQALREQAAGVTGQNVPTDNEEPAITNESPFSVGDEAENPETGEVIVWDGNSWQPKT